MKNSTKKQLLNNQRATKWLFILLLLFMFSCSKEEELSLIKTEHNEIDREAWQIHNSDLLNSVGLGLIDLSKDKRFRDLVHKKVNEKFDGEEAVLLKNLNEEFRLQEKIISSIDNNAKNIFERNKLEGKKYSYYSSEKWINKAINGYQIGDETWYSHIYIPFINKIDLNTLPTIVIVPEDGGDCTFLGYKPSQNGKYEPILVNEQYAEENLTWVIAVNESVDNDGVLFRDKYTDYTREQRGQRNPDLYVLISEINISDKKECWACGKADVSINFRQLSSNCSFGDDANDFKDYVDVGNDDLGNWMTFSTIGGNGQAWFADNIAHDFINTERIIWVMYEYDKWKDPVAVTFSTSCGVSRIIEYKSNEPYYGKWGDIGPSSFSGYQTFSGTNQVDEFIYGNEKMRTISYEW
jgi:hypothetical protein